MQINFITRRGGNDYHGRVYEDFRNRDLNANSWSNNGQGIPRPPFILNDSAAASAGQISKNKLFFFGSFTMSKQPGTISASNLVFTPAAQRGRSPTLEPTASPAPSNVLSMAHSFNSALPATVNPMIASELIVD